MDFEDNRDLESAERSAEETKEPITDGDIRIEVIRNDWYYIFMPLYMFTATLAQKYFCRMQIKIYIEVLTVKLLVAFYFLKLLVELNAQNSTYWDFKLIYSPQIRFDAEKQNSWILRI